MILTEEGTYADLERDGTRARHGKQRSNDEVEDDEQCRREHRPRFCAQQRDILPARECDRCDAEQRQTDTRRHEAQHRKHCVIACCLTECRGEDEIARAKVDGEHHEAERQQVFFL